MVKIKKVAILGAGAVGAYLLWGLSKKEDVDLGVVASGDRAKKLKQNGLIINGTAYYPKVWEPSEAKGADLLIVSLKYGSLLNASDDIKAIVEDNTIVMSLMNGVDSEDIIASMVGKEHVLPSLIKIASRRTSDGVQFDADTTIGIVFGENGNQNESERVKAICDLFDKTEIHFRATEYIIEEIWSKYRLNVCNNLPQAILGAGVGCYTDSEHMKAISDGLRNELEAIAKAKGIDLTKADKSSNHGSVVKASARYSTLQDIDAKRHTEIDMFSGTLVRMGKELGIPTPYNEYTYHMIKALEEKNDGLFNYETSSKMCNAT